MSLSLKCRLGLGDCRIFGGVGLLSVVLCSYSLFIRLLSHGLGVGLCLHGRACVVLCYFPVGIGFICQKHRLFLEEFGSSLAFFGHRLALERLLCERLRGEGTRMRSFAVLFGFSP